MHIRSELALGGDYPRDSEELDWVNPDLISPRNAAELARVRENIMFQPQDVLLDTYQSVTELELKERPGSPQASWRYASGLKEELDELVTELDEARAENPFLESAQPGGWMAELLDRNRIRMTDILPVRKEKYLSELGDVLWYQSRMAADLDSSMSGCFLKFLRQSEAGHPLEKYLGDASVDRTADQAARILSFEWVQKISLAQKMAFYLPPESATDHKTTIDSNPGAILRAIADELEPGEGDSYGWSPDNSFPWLRDAEATIGKLIWFSAYTANTLLNADFSVVMKANLEKITARSRRGTTFSKKDRTGQDESSRRASPDPRAPLSS